MKKLNKKKIGIVIVGIIAIILIITVVLIVIKNKNSKEEKIETPYEFEEEESKIDMFDTTNSEIRNDGMKINTSEEIKNGIDFQGLKVSEIQIEASGSMSTFNAKVTNNFEKDIEGRIIYLVFLDKKENEIAKVEAYMPDILAGEECFITATTPEDIATAYSLKIEE